MTWWSMYILEGMEFWTQQSSNSNVFQMSIAEDWLSDQIESSLTQALPSVYIVAASTVCHLHMWGTAGALLLCDLLSKAEALC